MNGIDAVLVSFTADRASLVGAHSAPYPEPLRARLVGAESACAGWSATDVGTLDVLIGHAFGDAAMALLRATNTPSSAVRAIGSHGQTLLHSPSTDPPFTLQAGDPHIIAARTGITTVSSFRGMDVALGGQGAPLVPVFHEAFFRRPGVARCALNLGGIANVTVLDADASRAVTGFDTGPGNALLDVWIGQCMGLPMDVDGAWASSGRVHPGLLDALLADPYFAMPWPKSTGRDYFNLAWAERRGGSLLRELPPKDVQATLVELTVASVADGITRAAPGTSELIVCGGGARNHALMHALRVRLPGCRVASSTEHGIEPELVEAAAFAYLAKLRLEGRPGNLPSVTGAARPAMLGAVVEAPQRIPGAA